MWKCGRDACCVLGMLLALLPAGCKRRAEPVTVTVSMFSGLPDPHWKLDAWGIEALKERMAGLSVANPSQEQRARMSALGYRGLVVRSKEIPGLPETIKVLDGVVRVSAMPFGPEAEAQYFNDNNDVEGWLLEQAFKRQLAPKVKQLLREHYDRADRVGGDVTHAAEGDRRIAWGEAVNGLQAGLVVAGRSTDRIVSVKLVLRNAGQVPLKGCTLCQGWRSVWAGGYEEMFRPDSWKSDRPHDGQFKEHIVLLKPGETTSITSRICRDRLKGYKKTSVRMGYEIGEEFAGQHYTWSGKVTTGAVEIEVAAP